jgi:hypothetical protein
MVPSFGDVSELELGPAAAAEVTESFYRDLFTELTAEGFLGALMLKREVFLDAHDLPPAERLQAGFGRHDVLMDRLLRQGQKGFHMALVFETALTPLRMLVKRGYVQNAATSSTTAVIIRNWADWLTRHVTDGNGVLIFGHDYEPALLFNRVVALS